MNNERTPLPPPVPASPRAGQDNQPSVGPDGHMHWENPKHDKPGLWERINTTVLLTVIVIASLLAGGIVGMVIGSNTSGDTDSCRTTVTIGEDLLTELNGALDLSAQAIGAYGDYDHRRLEEINLALDEHIGTVETLAPEYEIAKNRCGV